MDTKQATDMLSLILYQQPRVIFDDRSVYEDTKIPRTMYGKEEQGQVDKQMKKLVMRSTLPSNWKSKPLRRCSVTDGQCDEILNH